MPNMPSVALCEGQTILGFVVRSVTPLPRQFAVAVQLEHQKTGARVLHLVTEDAENLFSVSFPTPPADDTGLPHIMEHSVLGGSKRFPVKDPFFEMIKSSMATFINAMTGYDCTYYPVSSNVRKDFFNLAEVYWDAVFHANLTRETFQREGHHLELAEPANPQSDLIYKGIVFNEMKGVFSSPSAILDRASLRGLFPDNAYGRESGGDPVAIPTLTYEQFIAFHQTFYHPSNAYIFLYGDIPTETHLAFLAGRLEMFDRQPVDVHIDPQKPWPQPRQQTLGYPVGADEPTTGKTYLMTSWIVGDGVDPSHVFLMDVVDILLLGTQGAPLRKALIDSQLGDSLSSSGFSGGILQGVFNVGLQGSEADRTQAYVDLVQTTLQKAADEGFADERVEAAFHQLAYDQLEIGSNFPLRQLWAIKPAWIHGRDPLAYIHAAEHLEALKNRWKQDKQIFQKAIRTYLVDNPHRLTLTMVPEHGYAARVDAAEKASLAKIRASLTPDQLLAVTAEATELDRLANLPNTPEMLATLPQLQVVDLPRQPRHIPTTVETLDGGVQLLVNDVFANGINYLQLDIDLSHLDAALLPYLPMYADCVRKMGAAGLDFIAMSDRISANTGGVGFGSYCITGATDPSVTIRRGRFSLRFLDDNADKAMDVLEDLLFSLDLNDVPRLKDVVRQSASGHRSSLAESGMSLALAHAGRGISPVAYVAEHVSGLPQTRLVISLADQFDAKQESLRQNLSSIRSALAHKQNLVASFTGQSAVVERVRQRLNQWSSRMNGSGGIASTLPFEPYVVPPREGLATSMQVAFCTRVFPAPHTSSPDFAAITVGTRILSMDYLLDEIRFKGTAYGAGCSYNASAQTCGFYSYRDPWVKRTLDVFDGAMANVAAADWDKPRVDRAIISTAKAGERPIRPGEATGSALSRFISGETREIRNQMHAGILSLTPGKVKQTLLDFLEKEYSRGAVCVVSSRQKLAEGSLDVEDIL